jgi:cell division FtsZ-interacting protein ZapD
MGIRAVLVGSFRDIPDGSETRINLYKTASRLYQRKKIILEIRERKKMTTMKITPETINSLRRELQQVRQASLQATRIGDFMKVARLTATAARINKSIMDAEGELLAQS